MGVFFNVFKKCPTCGARAVMQLRGEVYDVDLDDLEELARNRNPEEILDLYDWILRDGDPFVCESGGWDHRFHLDTGRRLVVARLLFGDNE